MKPQPLNLSSGMLALWVSILWGGNVVAIKLGLGTLPPFWSAFWRFLVGAVTVLVWAWIKRAELMPKREDRGSAALLGCLFAAQISCLNLGVSLTSPAYGVVLLNAHPVFTNLFGHFVDSEDKLNFRRLAGLALAVMGMSYVATGKPDAALAPNPIAGNLILILSAALLAIRALYTRRLVQRVNTFKPVVWQMAFALPVFLGFALLLEPPLLKPVTWPPVAAIFYQGAIIGGFCFVTWTQLLQKHAAGVLSMFAFLVPFFGVFLSAYMFDETIQPSLLLGASLVTIGIVIVTRFSGK
ncbi:MAG: DMT family transporter [Thermoanaerobaculales bacterium]|nr:DMT family transporter [Thermoanaerobaculales bacterium]